MSSFCLYNVTTLQQEASNMDKNKFLKQFGENVKEQRRALGLTQEELAKKLGYSSAAMISKLEKGQTDIGNDKLSLLVDIFHVDARVLLFGGSVQKSTTDKILQAVELMNDDQLEQTWNYIEKIVLN